MLLDVKKSSYGGSAPQEITVRRQKIPEGGREQIDLLSRLLVQRNEEMDPDAIPELDTLIDNVCQERDS